MAQYDGGEDQTRASSGTSPPLKEVLHRPPALLCPDRVTFARGLDSATRNLNLAHTHETTNGADGRPSGGFQQGNAVAFRYELAYPLYLAAATGFLWAARNVSTPGVMSETSSSSSALSEGSSSSQSQSQAQSQDRATKLRDNLMRQAKRAMQRAEKIREVKGPEWARRWGGPAAAHGGHGVASLDIESQTRVLRESSHINGLKLEPWLGKVEASGDALPAAHPLPVLSDRQKAMGAHFRSGSQAGSDSGSSAVLLDPAMPIRGSDITQDAVNNCGLVAALEVMAEHDHRMQTSLLRWPLVAHPPDAKAYTARLNLNGCLRQIHIDDALPFYKSEASDDGEERLLCAAVSTHDRSKLVLLPPLIEKAYLSVQRTYAPQGSVPAEDLHVLTGWLPEVLEMHSSASSFQQEKTWERLHAGWESGNLLICAGTSASKATEEGDVSIHWQEDATGSETGLIAGHCYAVLSLSSSSTSQRVVQLMNPWRPASTSGSSKPKAFTISWERFCHDFSSLHLAWDPTRLFRSVTEAHAAWPPNPDTDATQGRGTDAPQVRNVELLLTVTENSQVSVGGEDEIWLHLIRHLPSSNGAFDSSMRYIAIHVFERGVQASSSRQHLRIIPVGADRGRPHDFVDSAHHLIRFRPSFLVRSVLREDEPGISHRSQALTKQYTVVVSLHDLKEQGDARFTLRAWSQHAVEIEQVRPEGDAWSHTIRGEWASHLSAGGHSMSPLFHTNPQYLFAVPPSTPHLDVDLTLQTTPPLPAHIWVLFAPPPTTSSLARPCRVDRVEHSQVLADSGPYAQGLTKVQARLPPIPHGQQGRYVVVVSNYRPGDEGRFQLTVECKQRRLQQVVSRSALLSLTDRDALAIYALQSEGAGMFGKTSLGRWSTYDSSAAGAPRFGNFESNPKWLITLSSDKSQQSGDEISEGLSKLSLSSTGRHTRGTFRLTATGLHESKDNRRKETHVDYVVQKGGDEDHDDDNEALPPINLSLFRFSNPATRCNSVLGDEIATTGPYLSSPTGVSIQDVQLETQSADGQPASYVLIASTWKPDVQRTFELRGWCESKDWNWRPL